MSYTELFAAKKSGRMVGFAKFSNSYGGAFFVWEALKKKYFPEWGDCYFLMSPDRTRLLWDLAKPDSRANDDERGTLLSTFDWVLCQRERLSELAGYFRKFQGEHWKGDVVCHLSAQADVLDKLAKDKTIIAVGWNQTSVNGDAWLEYKNEKSRPYNIKRGNKHWFMFEEAAASPADAKEPNGKT